MNKIKKGFTLAEVVVTLAVIGMVAGISIPILHNAKIDKDVIVYRKAMYTLQQATYKFMNGNKYQELMRKYNGNERLFLANFKNNDVCEGIADEMNTRGVITCDNSDGGLNFVTNDGIGFYNLGGTGDFTHKQVQIKRVGERKSETEARKKKEGADQTNGYLRIFLNYRGKISVPNEDVIRLPDGTTTSAEYFKYEQTLIQDYTKLNNNKK